MSKRNRGLLLYVTIVLCCICLGCSRISANEQPIDHLDDQFDQLIGEVDYLNDGLNLDASKSAIDISETPNEYLSFDVEVTGAEPIVFEDIHFGLRVFSLENITEREQVWREISIPIYPEKQVIELGSDSPIDVIDSFHFLLRTLKTVDFGDQIRFYISGTGKNSNLIYGAYVTIENIDSSHE